MSFLWGESPEYSLLITKKLVVFYPTRLKRRKDVAGEWTTKN